MVKVQTFDRHQVWRCSKTRQLMSIQFGELAMQGLLKILSQCSLKDSSGGDFSVA